MRSYDHGQIVGAVDEPTTTLREWLTSELKTAQKAHRRDEPRSGMVGRICALRETLYQMDRRRMR